MGPGTIASKTMQFLPVAALTESQVACAEKAQVARIFTALAGGSNPRKYAHSTRKNGL
jgi:hypothetical protein